MNILHIVPGLDNPFNGIAVAAKLIAGEQAAEIVDAREFGKIKDLAKYGEVWVHSCWLPMTLKACRRVVKAKRPLVRMTHANLDPVRLKYHGWKKWLVGPIERYWLRKADRIVATCDAEKAWIEAYLGKRCPEIVVEDVKRFFKLGVRGGELAVSGGEVEPCRSGEGESLAVSGQRLAVRGQKLGVSGDGCNSEQETRNKKLHILYLGRRHPLKGVEYLEKAVDEINDDSRSRESKLNSGIGNFSYEENLSIHCSTSTSNFDAKRIDLRIVSGAKGEELEKVWDWCDVLVLPTLSENFGLVVAEALERGKRVITTDGAPVWGEGVTRVDRVEGGGVFYGYNGRLLYLKGYRDGTDSKRVELLKDAIRLYLG